MSDTAPYLVIDSESDSADLGTDLPGLDTTRTRSSPHRAARLTLRCPDHKTGILPEEASVGRRTSSVEFNSGGTVPRDRSHLDEVWGSRCRKDSPSVDRSRR